MSTDTRQKSALPLYVYERYLTPDEERFLRVAKSHGLPRRSAASINAETLDVLRSIRDVLDDTHRLLGLTVPRCDELRDRIDRTISETEDLIARLS